MVRVIATAALVPWLVVGGLGALLLAGFAGGFLLLAMGRLTLDLGWGRTVHPLGPITTRVDAPRELVFEVMTAPYVGRAPGDGVDVYARGVGLAVAAHHTKVHFYTARTVELIELEPSRRVGFRHLAGPVPHAVERLELRDAGGATEIEYSGEIGLDFFALGRIAARRWVRPQWERAVREHLEGLRSRAEQRAEGRVARAEGG